MKRMIPLVVVGLIAASCGQPGDLNLARSDSAEVMAASLEQLLTEDNTFGGGGSPFTLLLVQDRTDENAGSPDDNEPALSRELTSVEMEAIEGALADHGEVRWIDNPSEWRTDELLPVEENSVILGVGSPTFEGDTALVPVSLWCSGLCGTWFTYRLDRIDGIWRVTDTVGPVAVS